MSFTVHLSSFLFLTGIILISSEVVHSEKTSRCSKNFILMSTLDGSITALDLHSGLQCWSVALDPEKFVSSSLSKLEVYENGRRVTLVPSLDGSLYTYDSLRKRITALPINVETLISRPAYLDPYLIINGGKIKITHGINRFTGEVIYTCNFGSCINFKTPFPEHMLIIEEIIQSINAIDTNKGERRWHFRVVELKIVPTKKDFSGFANISKDTALILQIPPKVDDFINVDEYKISLQNGFLGMLNKTRDEFSWIFKAPSPINDAWIVIDDLAQVLDPFDKESGFYSVDMNDGRHSALLFLGTYEKQSFIKRSRKLQLKHSGGTSLIQNVDHDYLDYDAFIIPVCLRENPPSGTHVESDGTSLAPHNDHEIDDYGIFFYANLSITENATHCILNSTLIMKNEFPVRAWLAVIGVCIVITFCLGIFYRDFREGKIPKHKTVSVAVSSVATSFNEDFVTVSPNEEFRSRFHQDFELVSVLGKGGFGVVMDVKNKIDDCHYAVKRIGLLHKELNNFQYERVLREVKALAKLEHHGIVRYFNAWFEYPPAGWQEKKDKDFNFKVISSTSEDDDEKVESKKKKKSDLKFQKQKSSKPIAFKILKYNPLQLSDNDLFFDDVSFMQSKLKADSSSDVNDNNCVSSAENSSSGSSENNKPPLNKYTDDSESFIQFAEEYRDNDSDSSVKSASEKSSGKFGEKSLGLTKCTEDASDSDSFIQFENDDLNLSNPEIKKFKKYSEDSGKSYVESTEGKSSIRSRENSCLKKKSLQKKTFLSTKSKYHVSCYEGLRLFNEALVYPLELEEFNVLASFIFCNKTLTKSVNMSNWKNVMSSFTIERMSFYQKWLICILCKIHSPSNFTCSVAEKNLCYILSDINDQLYGNKYSLDAKSAQSVNVSYDQGKVKDPWAYSSKKQKNFKVNRKKIIPVTDYAKGYLYIQMQLCQKKSLKDWLTEHTDSRDYNKVMEIFSEIVDAVHYVHSCGLMHRDLKPSNIFFSMEGAIKIGDFGLATSSEIKVENGSSNQPSNVHTSDIGTELYMSPEQKLKQDYDCKTDIYSLGIILFELLVPFKTYSERCKVLVKVREFIFPEEFKSSFQAESELVELLLRDNPEERPSTSEIKQHPVIQKFISTLK